MRKDKNPINRYNFIDFESNEIELPLSFRIVKMMIAATKNLTPAEIRGVSESRPNLIATQVEPQIKQMKM